ncbi:phage recombination protein Bet [Methanolobus sp. WCC5]|uniref:phage recombination protein Bet n=1 Tax=Methanolobus sp. WCC5 TaxID=3125785 RepID=UPI00324D6548
MGEGGIMVMSLDKKALVPILESAGFKKTNPNIWLIEKDGTPYGIDFAKNDIFRLEGTERILEDKTDTYLNTIIEMCVNTTVRESKKEACEICRNSGEHIEKYGQVLCADCLEKADENGGIPPAVLIVGWEEYKKLKQVEEPPEHNEPFADNVQEPEEPSREKNVPENNKSVDELPEEATDCEVVNPEELTHEQRLKVAEMVQENGYDKETAVSIVKGTFKHGSKSPAVIPHGYVPKLDIQDVKMYLCPLATDQEAYVFLELCKARGLNPFTNEVYLIKYNEKDKAQAVVGKETFTRKAEQNPSFAGFEAGIIVRNEAREIERRPGTFYVAGEELLGGWAKVYRADKARPFADEVPLSEYIQVTKDGQPNKFWRTKPGTMIRKVALCHALREAFPSEFGGLHDQSELGAEA